MHLSSLNASNKIMPTTYLPYCPKKSLTSLTNCCCSSGVPAKVRLIAIKASTTSTVGIIDGIAEGIWEGG